jgi:hypothetical protein
MEAPVEMGHEDVPRPPMERRLLDVKHARGRLADLVEDPHEVAPRDARDALLHEPCVRPGFGHRAHVLEVPGREALHLRESPPQIARESVDDLAAPADLGLSRQEVAADAPVEEHQLAVGLQRCAVPRLDDAGLQRFEERVIRGPGDVTADLRHRPARRTLLTALTHRAAPPPSPGSAGFASSCSASNPTSVYCATAVAR